MNKELIKEHAALIQICVELEAKLNTIKTIVDIALDIPTIRVHVQATLEGIKSVLEKP